MATKLGFILNNLFVGMNPTGIFIVQFKYNIIKIKRL